MNERKKKSKWRGIAKRGSVSILLSIILIPCLTFTGLMVDYANIIMSKAVAESSGELVTNAALANYDAVLEDVYGLFAMSQNEEELAVNLEKYFRDTLSANGIMPEQSEFSSNTMSGVYADINDYLGTVMKDDLNRNFLQVQYADFKADGVEGSELTQSDVLKNQIVEFMKYRGPAEVGLDLISSLNAFKLANDKTKVAKVKMDVDTAKDELGDYAKEFYDAIVKYDELVAEFKEAETAFESQVDSLNGEMKIINDALVLLYQAPELPEIKYVELAEVENEPDDYKISGVLKSAESDYEKLLQSINSKMIEMEEDETTLKGKRNSIDSFNMKDKVKYYPIFAEYMGMAEELEAMSLRLREFDTTTYNLKRKAGESDAEYQMRVEAEQVNQKQVLQAMEDVLKEIYRSLQGSTSSGYRKGYEEFRTKIATAKNDVDTRMPKVTKAVANYCLAAIRMLEAERDPTLQERMKFWEDGEAFIDYAIRMGKTVKEKIAEVQKENKKFEAAIKTYKKKQSADDYYATMKSEADQNKETFTPEDVDEILEQLKAGKKYLTADNGVLSMIEDWTFYTGKFKAGNLNTGSGAQNLSRIEFDKINFDVDKADTYYNTYFPNKFSTKISSRTAGFYPKQIKEARVQAGDVTYNVPAYYLYLVATYGMETEEDDRGDNLKETATNINEEAREDAKDTEDASEYSADVFDVLENENGSDGSISEFEDIDDSNTGILKQFKRMAKTVNNILGVLNGGLENARDNLLVTEYIFENFSFATYDKQAGFNAKDPKFKTMTMQEINKNNNTIYGCEIEYILKGYRGGSSGWWFAKSESGPEENVAMVKADIFTIRFVMNSIFALTDGSLDAQTLPPALAIQAATAGIFPYQVAQVVLKLCLALTESTWDMQQLMAGEKIPLVKDRSSWKMSVEGMMGTVTNAAAEKVSTLLGDAVNNISDYLQQCVNDAGDWANLKAEEAAGKVREVTANVTKEIQGATRAALEEALGAMTQIVTDKIQEEYNNIFAEGVKYTTDRLKSTTRKALNKYIDESKYSTEVKGFLKGQVEVIINSMVDNGVSAKLKSCSDSFQNSITGEIAIDPAAFAELTEQIEAGVTDCMKKISGQIEKEITTLTSAVVSKVTSPIKGLIGKTAENASRKIEEEISKYLSDNFPSKEVSLKGTTQTSRGNMSNLFSFGYEDYLELFVFLELSGDNEPAVIRRIADVIELNVDSGLKDYYAAKGISPVENFSMNQAYTYVELSAEIRALPLLLSQDIFMRGTGEKKAFDYWSYPYSNIAGY